MDKAGFSLSICSGSASHARQRCIKISPQAPVTFWIPIPEEAKWRPKVRQVPSSLAAKDNKYENNLAWIWICCWVPEKRYWIVIKTCWHTHKVDQKDGGRWGTSGHTLPTYAQAHHRSHQSVQVPPPADYEITRAKCIWKLKLRTQREGRFVELFVELPEENLSPVASVWDSSD